MIKKSTFELTSPIAQQLQSYSQTLLDIHEQLKSIAQASILKSFEDISFMLSKKANKVLSFDKPVYLTDAEFNYLQSSYSKIHRLIEILHDVVNPQVMKKIIVIQKGIEQLFEATWNLENELEDKERDCLENIRQNHNFMSIWSNDALSSDMNLKLPNKVKQITYESWGPTQVVDFGKKGKSMTWLEMWKEADKLIRSSGDTHHIFIESFEEDKKNPGCYRLYTGS